jgi:ribokinase
VATVVEGTAMSERPRIVLVGSMNFDCVARADRLPRKGETILGTSFGTFPGGKGANQAVQMGRLGAEVYMVGRVGDDFMADIVLASLKAAGVSTEFVHRDASVTTGVACINVDQNGDNTIVIVPQANRACSPQDVDAAAGVIRSADVVVCQFEIALPTVARAAAMAADQGVKVILNPAPPAREPLPAGLLALTSILTPNETEAEALSGIAGLSPGASEAEWTAWESAVAGKLLAMGPSSVVVTLGERGAFWATDRHEELVPAYRVQAVDVTAAGDAFNGALAVALAEGREMRDAIRFANAAGALAAMRAGAQPSLATRDEVEAFLRERNA